MHYPGHLREAFGDRLDEDCPPLGSPVTSKTGDLGYDANNREAFGSDPWAAPGSEPTAPGRFPCAPLPPADTESVRRGWRGWRKHIARVVRRRKPDDLISPIGTAALLAVGLVGLYFAGTVGLYVVFVLIVLVAFVIGLSTRGVKWLVRRASSRTTSSTDEGAGEETDPA